MAAGSPSGPVPAGHRVKCQRGGGAPRLPSEAVTPVPWPPAGACTSVDCEVFEGRNRILWQPPCPQHSAPSLERSRLPTHSHWVTPKGPLGHGEQHVLSGAALRAGLTKCETATETSGCGTTPAGYVGLQGLRLQAWKEGGGETVVGGGGCRHSPGEGRGSCRSGRAKGTEGRRAGRARASPGLLGACGRVWRGSASVAGIRRLACTGHRQTGDRVQAWVEERGTERGGHGDCRWDAGLRGWLCTQDTFRRPQHG